MFASLKQLFFRIRSLRRGEIAPRPPIDRDDIDYMLEHSRIPAVLMLVLVWTVASVLLIITQNRQRLLLDWVEGQKAPYSIHAAADFEYVDSAATEKKRREAEAAVPPCYRLDDRRILADVESFFRRIGEREKKKPEKKAETLPDQLADEASGELVKALARERGKDGNYPRFAEDLRRMLARGVGSVEGRTAQIAGVDSRYLLTGEQCAMLLAETLLPGSGKPLRKEFQGLLEKLIGPGGNLVYDANFTEEARRKAAAAVEPVEVSREKGSLLIRKGEKFTKATREMVDAERKAASVSGFYNTFGQLLWSFVIVLSGVVFLFVISRDTFRDNLRLLLAGLTVAAALAVNYESLRLFGYLLRDDVIHNEKLVTAAIPAAFAAVVLAVVLDLRTAICSGGLVAVITAMMILPDRSLELALRWTAISTGAVMMVHKVINYRSFFVRTLLGVLAMTALLNLDALDGIRSGAALYRMAGEAFWVIAANAAACAMLALLMIFILELVFNLSTDMALMVLSDCNHPLLERLKREAPGTMAHAMAVATLAEDAARAIGANPLRAKAGALFHDIGKLTKPEYFTENNPASSLLHDKLTPQMSSSIIRGHVTDGVMLARQHRLCRFIRNVIASHHGDDLVRFFYHKATEESKRTGAPVLESQFRYGGPRPVGKEAGIISLADACEAASRSLKEPTEEKVAGLVANIVQGRFRDGSLRDSRLSAAELYELQKSFTATLSSGMHVRIAYPEGVSAAAGGGEKKC